MKDFDIAIPYKKGDIYSLARENFGIGRKRLGNLLSCLPANAGIEMDAKNLQLRIQANMRDGGVCQFALRPPSDANPCQMHIFSMREEHPGQGRLKALFPKLMEFADQARISVITLRAIEIGRYAWLRYGFLPDEKSWSALRMAMQKWKRSRFSSVDPVWAEITDICKNSSPIACRRTLHPPGRKNRRWEKEFWLDKQTPCWDGALDLSRDCQIALAYCRQK